MSAMRAELSPELLRKLLSYDPETGELTWRERTPDLFEATAKRSALHACRWWNARFSGRPAFTARTNEGYAKGNILAYQALAHVVIWAYMTGEWPGDDMQIDHRNGVRDFNAWHNLRLGTRSNNQWNRRSDGGASKYKGVSRFAPKSKPATSHSWVARITYGGQRFNLGSFNSEIAAAKAYDEAAMRFHGEHAVLNFPDGTTYRAAY